MKKNLALIVFLVVIFYSLDSSASPNKRWTPDYTKNTNIESVTAKTVNQSIEKKPKKLIKTKTKAIKHSDLDQEQAMLLSFFKMNLKGASGKKVSSKALKLAGKAIPVLLKVMKNGSYPDNSRWLATFLTGRIMGKKAAPLMAKYAVHPNWILRLSSLKVLQALGQKKYEKIYAQSLKDKALIVRVQALEIVNSFNLKSLAPNVWNMLSDEQNYKGPKGKRQRTDIVKKAIITLGNLDFKKVKKVMQGMINDKKYVDISNELKIAVSKL